ncbi:MAG: hypothetical protein KIT80_21165 [Chitinophagaceae bacterium]|nr:hypothetical protein [Chitinophagaceae bacterium]MCW5929445.1 hypothetical protein [Chitinophagaceae bacterium]
MNKTNINEKELTTLLKESGLEKPTEEFSKRLSYMVTQRYKQNPAMEYKAEKWLGRFILSVLIFFNLLFLYYLNPFSIQPEFFISVSAFVLGFWGLIGLVRKSQVSIS